MSALTYALLRPLLFALDAETVHDRTIGLLAATQHTALRHLYRQLRIGDPVQLCGLNFSNRIGLAAGLDKNARCIDAWQAMGFGFVEVGTVTPLAQPGNPKPRIFRLPQAQALINRLGFNNQGLESFLSHVGQARFRQNTPTPMLLGLNIGKNAATPIEQANSDYLTCQYFQPEYKKPASVADR
jgi:dihydroorotate dehydrogenase